MMEEPEWYFGVGKHGEPVKCYKSEIWQRSILAVDVEKITKKLEELEKRIQSLEADRKRYQD